MRHSDREAVRAELEAWRDGGNHVDPRLLAELSRPGDLFLITLDDVDSFLSLIWQESDPARLLTPRTEPRTLRDVVERLRKLGHSLERLRADLGLPRTEHHPEWFEPCARIDAAFDYERFGRLAVVPATDGERAQSLRGSFYVFDGMHKSLVLAKRLLADEVEFRPIEALLLVPRPK